MDWTVLDWTGLDWTGLFRCAVWTVAYVPGVGRVLRAARDIAVWEAVIQVISILEVNNLLLQI